MRTKITHQLKSWPAFFDAVSSGVKTFELRRNDRGFEVGDEIVLEEFRPGLGEFTGRTLRCEITYIATPATFGGLEEGFVILGIIRAGSA